MGTVSFPGVKRPGRCSDHPPQSSAEVRGGMELYFYAPSGLSWSVLGRTLPLPLPLPALAYSLYWLRYAGRHIYVRYT
jgi:hypothetical protein